MPDDAINRTNADFRAMLLQPSSAGAAQDDAMDVVPADTAPNAEPQESDWTELRLQRGQLQMQPMLLTGLLRQCGPAIRVLDLSGCREHVHDGVLRSVAAYCPDIQKLDISECDITDAGIVVIASGCAALDVLNISHCSEVTDEGLKAIAQRRGYITTFECVGCARVTDAGKALLEASLGVVGTGE